VRYERDLKRLASHLHDGQRNAVERDRAFVDEIVQNIVARREPHAPYVVFYFDPRRPSDTVDMALHEVAAESVGHSQRKLEVDAVAALEITESSARYGLRDHLGGKASPRGGGRSETGATDRDGVPDVQRAGHTDRIDLEVEHATPSPAAADAAALDHDPGEHLKPVPARA
jgi:hypothetical protein